VKAGYSAVLKGKGPVRTVLRVAQPKGWADRWPWMPEDQGGWICNKGVGAGQKATRPHRRAGRGAGG